MWLLGYLAAGVGVLKTPHTSEYFIPHKSQPLTCAALQLGMKKQNYDFNSFETLSIHEDKQHFREHFQVFSKKTEFPEFICTKVLPGRLGGTEYYYVISSPLRMKHDYSFLILQPQV